MGRQSGINENLGCQSYWFFQILPRFQKFTKLPLEHIFFRLQVLCKNMLTLDLHIKSYITSRDALNVFECVSGMCVMSCLYLILFSIEIVLWIILGRKQIWILFLTNQHSRLGSELVVIEGQFLMLPEA